MEQITVRQFKILIALNAIGAGILAVPGGLIADAKQDAWIAILLCIFYVWLLFLLYSSLNKLYPQQNLAQICETVLGKYLGKLCCLQFAFFSFYDANSIIWYIGNFLTSQMNPKIPVFYLELFFTIIIVLTFISGLQSFGRLAELCFPFVFLMMLLLFIFLLPQLKPVQIFPIYEHGLRGIVKASLQITSFSGWPMYDFLMIYPNCSKKHSTKLSTIFFPGFLWGISILFICVLFTIMTIGGFAAQSTSSFYTLTMLINLPGIFERSEKFLVLVWLLTIFFKTMLHYYAEIISLAQILNIKDYKPLALVMGFSMLPFSLNCYRDSVYQGIWDSQTWLSYSTVTCVIIPLILLFVGKLKNFFKN